MHHGIPYKMGTKGVDCQQFTQELFACPRLAVEASGISDHDLNIFTQDVPFNFAAEQVLETLDDLGALAKVSRLCTLCA